jgi:PKHD-type hydroxylase
MSTKIEKIGNDIITFPLGGNVEAKQVYVIPSALSLHEINYLNSFVIKEEVEEGLGKNRQQIDMRNNVGVVWLRNDVNYGWLYTKIAGLVRKANTTNFNLALTHMETLQYTMYNDVSESYYGQHIDQLIEFNKPTKRKLSFSIQLTPSEGYDGGNLEIYNGTDFVTPRGLGDMIFFESHVLHEVTKVTKGTRHSLVGWVHGPNL